MAEKIEDGGPAFPSHGSMGEVVQTGMTLREYFAAAALTGLLSRYVGAITAETYAQAVSESLKFSDAMLSSRNKEVRP